MTCAACVNRVEKRLARIEGVRATVNLATGRARVSHPPEVTAQDLVAAVERAGYTAELPAPPRPVEDGTPPGGGGSPGREESQRLLITALLSVPVLILSMVPALQFRNWQWLCFVLAAPVAVWGAWSFHSRALRGLRHAAATMDTLVSLGVVASFSWSAYALFLGGAGDPGMRMPFSLLPSAGGDVAHIYLEAAVGVPLFVLTGRFLESRARRGTGEALRSLAGLAAKDQLTGVTSPDIEKALLSRHRSSGFGADTMEMTGSVRISAGGTLAMSPFDVSVMARTRTGWEAGDTVPFVLHFRHSAPVKVFAVVVRPGG
ncbi:cation transporter [Streptomyces avidinii]